MSKGGAVIIPEDDEPEAAQVSASVETMATSSPPEDAGHFRADAIRRSLAREGTIGMAGGCSLDAVEALADKLPESRDRIRRRYWRDPAFRAVCDDHRDALGMLDRLGKARPPVPAQVERYRELVDDLFAEAAGMLAAGDPP